MLVRECSNPKEETILNASDFKDKLLGKDEFAYIEKKQSIILLDNS